MCGGHPNLPPPKTQTVDETDYAQAEEDLKKKKKVSDLKKSVNALGASEANEIIVQVSKVNVTFRQQRQ